MAAMLAIVVSSIPPPGALAALPVLAGPASPDGIPFDIDKPAFDSEPFPARNAVAWDSPTLDARLEVPADPWALETLPAVPPEARAVDAVVPGPEPASLAAAAAVATAKPVAAKPAAARAAPKPAVAKPPARSVVVRAAARPARMWAQLRRGLTVKGVATWYPGSRGYAGISHVAMPGARFLTRGRSAPRARVCAGGRCITVRVVDACACSVGSRRARVADLSLTALRRLGLNPRQGVYRVRVTLLRP